MKIDKVEKITVSKKLKESLNETWEMIRSKSVEDSDGFLTDYTMWANEDGSKYVFVFGDNDLYSPDNTDCDWECDSYEEAKEWFEGYDNEWPEYDDEIDLDEGRISQKKALSREELTNLEKELFDDLKKYDLRADGTFYSSDYSLSDVELVLDVDGDWKHDHLATEEVVEKFANKKGWTIVKHTQQEIGNSETDSYEAEHKWYFITDDSEDTQNTVNSLRKMFANKEESLNEEMKRFHFEYTVDGVKSEQTVSANNMQDAEALIKKQYADKSVSITKREEIKESLEEDFDDVPDAPATPTENGVASVINTLIQDEWQAISQYNDAIVTIQSAFPNEAITNILKDIVAEENRHVGQLQAAMGLVSPATEEISFGEEEGVEQINSVPTATDMLQQTAPVSFDTVSLDNPTILSDDEIDDTI